ncbi:carbohydrate-binding protein [Marinibactrum halimedae]|nr:carbohydrate-binding protein [Marinibactrum halimedae]MCD9460725.1 carbohydrate-binding protein [Marinibactrum halimedae]
MSANAVDYCEDIGGLKKLVRESYRDYSKSDFQKSNSGVKADLKIVVDELAPLQQIPNELSATLKNSLSDLKMSACQEKDLLYFYPTAKNDEDRTPIGILWRVGEIVLPGDESTQNNAVDPLIYQAPHFFEALPVAVRLMRETPAKAMIIALNKHNNYPDSMNAARPDGHVFLDVSNTVTEKYPQSAVVVLHGMGRDDKGEPDGYKTSGMIQPADERWTMNARKLFNVPSFNDLLAQGMGEALREIPDADPRLLTELRAPNGHKFGIANLTKFLWAVNTNHVNGFSTEHIKRIQAVHYEMPTTMRKDEIGGEPNSYLEGTQEALVLGIKKAMENYKQESAFNSTAEPKYCNSKCRQAYFRSQGISLYAKEKANIRHTIAVLPTQQDSNNEYDISFLSRVGSLKFPDSWNGAVTFYKFNNNDTEYLNRYTDSNSNTQSDRIYSERVELAVLNPIPNTPSKTVFIEAEAFDEKKGDVRESDDGGWIGHISTGNWVKYNNVDFAGGVDSLTVNIASKTNTSSGTIEVYLDSLDNQPVAVLADTPVMGGWNDFGLTTITLPKPLFGLHDVYLKFRYGYNLESFSFAPVQSVYIEAEHYNESKGDVREVNSKGWLGYIDTGNWVKYTDVAFGTGANTFIAEIASRTDTSSGAISVHLDSLENAPVAVLSDLPIAGGWNDFDFASLPLSKMVFGVHDVFLRFESGYNVDSIQFTSEPFIIE